ncbi:MAG TPA: DUF779 domain-containing protein [Pseudonocardia sp.]|jgi:hypothetical protein
MHPTHAARVALTSEAAQLLRSLRGEHGPLMFHQSGGCCDGSAPMCYPHGEFRTGDGDVHLGDLVVEGVAEPIGVWMSAAQFQYWRHTHLTIDVVDGRGSGFSLEAPRGRRFLIRSRLLTDRELRDLDGHEPTPSASPTGPGAAPTTSDQARE